MYTVLSTFFNANLAGISVYPEPVGNASGWLEWDSGLQATITNSVLPSLSCTDGSAVCTRVAVPATTWPF